MDIRPANGGTDWDAFSLYRLPCARVTDKLKLASVCVPSRRVFDRPHSASGRAGRQLEEAAAAYREASKEYTPRAPLEWARTQSCPNLAPST